MRKWLFAKYRFGWTRCRNKIEKSLQLTSALSTAFLHCLLHSRQVGSSQS